MFTKSSQLDALVRLADRIPSMLAYWDRDLRCHFANRAYERWFGVDANALIGTSIKDLLGPALFALNKGHIDAVLAGQPQTFERLVPGPDGVQRHSLAHYIPDVVDGEVKGFMVEVTEVTKLKQTEMALRAEIAARERAIERLRQSEAALQRAQHLGQLGSWELEAGTGIVTWSAELYRIFGFDPARLPPSYEQHSALFTAESWIRLQAAVELAMSTGAPYQVEVQYIPVDGAQGWLECRGEAIRDGDGTLVGLQGLAQVTTARHLGQHERDSRVLLVSKVSARTRTSLSRILGLAELIRRKPSDDTQSKWLRMIEDASMVILDGLTQLEELLPADGGLAGAAVQSEALGARPRENEALAMVVHELRNLLTPIKAGLGVLTFSIRHSDAVDRTLDALLRQVDHMSRLTSDLLNLSQIRAGTFQLVRARVALDQVVSEAVAISQPLMDKARHQLIVQLPSPSVWLNVDPLRMVQVLSNLLINAAKFTPASGRIELAAHQADDELLITVSDNGIGMSGSAMDSSFDLFDQCQQGGSPPPPVHGFGIGLAMVRQLVALHGGTVSVTSEGPGLGSSFLIRLPVTSD
jgi:PAS domain S-box-containing protein